MRSAVVLGGDFEKIAPSNILVAKALSRVFVGCKLGIMLVIMYCKSLKVTT
jgi:hypothetical protein